MTLLDDMIPGVADRQLKKDRYLGTEQDTLIAQQNAELAAQQAAELIALRESLGEFANPKDRLTLKGTTRTAYEYLQLQAGKFFELNPQLEAFLLITFMSAATAAPDVMAHHQVLNGILEGAKSAAVDLSVEPLTPEVRRE